MTQPEKTCWVAEFGLVPYARAFELQRRLVAARKAAAVPDVLLLCEHPHVITLGRNGRREHLRVSDHLLRQMGVEFQTSDRGGDITYHGPGQIVGYPILNLAAIRRDVAWYVRALEEVLIRATAEFGIAPLRKAGLTGVWVETLGGPEKLAAIGVHLSRWVTSHGFAYNVSTDLRYFDLIVPCGLPDKRATSLERLLGRRIDRGEVVPGIVSNFGGVFSLAMRGIPREELGKCLRKHGAGAVPPVGPGEFDTGAAPVEA